MREIPIDEIKDIRHALGAAEGLVRAIHLQNQYLGFMDAGEPILLSRLVSAISLIDGYLLEVEGDKVTGE